MLSIKTLASLFPQDHNFGDDYLALAPDPAKGVHDYYINDPIQSTRSDMINCLLLDLPFTNTRSSQLADGCFLASGIKHAKLLAIKKELFELADFLNLEEDYYYGVFAHSPLKQTQPIRVSFFTHR